jgi:hypothetical protein
LPAPTTHDLNGTWHLRLRGLRHWRTKDKRKALLLYISLMVLYETSHFFKSFRNLNVDSGGIRSPIVKDNGKKRASVLNDLPRRKANQGVVVNTAIFVGLLTTVHTSSRRQHPLK